MDKQAKTEVGVTYVKPVTLFVHNLNPGRYSIKGIRPFKQNHKQEKTENNSDSDEGSNHFNVMNAKIKTKSEITVSDSDSNTPTVDNPESEVGDVCNKALSEVEKSHLEMHRLINLHKSGPLPYACGDCKCRYSSLERLKFHKLDHKIRNGVFRCQKCKGVFKSSKRLYLHDKNVHPEKGNKRRHRNLTLYECEVCNSQYGSAKRLEFHKLEHEINNSIHKCKTCGGKFKTVKKLHEHDKNMHSETRKKRPTLTFGCEECKFRCSEEKRLEFHKLEHKNTNGKYQCKICEKIFNTTYKLYLHDYNIHSEISKQYNCKDCPYSAYTLQNLRSHELKHTLRCPTCSVQFTEYKLLKKHMNEQHVSTLYLCSECGLSFPAKSLLHQHEATHATIAGIKSSVCDLCNKRFTSELALQQHVARCHGKQKHQCNTCGRLFTQKYLLRRHETSHFVGLRHVCDICGKTYNRLHSLTNHMASHSGSKSHHCHICKNNFYTKYALGRHITRCHIDKLPVEPSEDGFLCTVCGKTYRKNYQLKEHMCLLSKSSRCETCGKSFKCIKSLKEHEGTHSDNVSFEFQCVVCKKRFRLKKGLNEHMKYIHGPEDKRIERLQRRVQQARARRQRKRLDKNEKCDSIDEEASYKPIFHPELNIIPPRQMEIENIGHNTTKTNTMMTDDHQLLLSESSDKKLTRPPAYDYSGDDSQNTGDDVATNQAPCIIADEDINEYSIDHTKVIGNENIQSTFNHSYVLSKECFSSEPNKPKEAKNNNLGKSIENINDALRSNIPNSNDFVSKTPNISNQNTDNWNININKVNTRHTAAQSDEVFQALESCLNADANSLQTFESDIVILSSLNMNHDERACMSEKLANKTPTKLKISYKCDACSITFQQQDTLVMHMAHVHGMDERNIKN